MAKLLGWIPTIYYRLRTILHGLKNLGSVYINLTLCLESSSLVGELSTVNIVVPSIQRGGRDNYVFTSWPSLFLQGVGKTFQDREDVRLKLINHSFDSG